VASQETRRHSLPVNTIDRRSICVQDVVCNQRAATQRERHSHGPRAVSVLTHPSPQPTPKRRSDPKMTVLAPRALDAENDGELSTGWHPKGLWIPAAAVTGWFLWAYFHLRPAGSVDSAAHPFAAYGPWSYGHLAYSDVISLYYAFHLGNHALPYVHTRVEYPVLTGIFMWLATWAPGVQGYFLASGLGLLACALGTLYFLHRIDWRFAWSFALCPLLLVYGLLNWDLLAIFFMVAGWAQLRARRYAWAGVLLSLGVWAKFFPIILLFYCVISLLRDPRHRVHARKMVLWSGMAALIVNAPFAVANVGNWDHFFVFNARRGGTSRRSIRGTER